MKNTGLFIISMIPAILFAVILGWNSLPFLRFLSIWYGLAGLWFAYISIKEAKSKSPTLSEVKEVETLIKENDGKYNKKDLYYRGKKE